MYSIINGLKKQFQLGVESMNSLLTVDFLPYFMFLWVPLLSLFGLESIAGVRIKLQQKMVLVIHSKIKTNALSKGT